MSTFTEIKAASNSKRTARKDARTEALRLVYGEQRNNTTEVTMGKLPDVSANVDLWQATRVRLGKLLEASGWEASRIAQIFGDFYRLQHPKGERATIPARKKEIDDIIRRHGVI